MIKSIQTEYRGIKYRSRTEARWAVFMDELRIPYAYEPEGFDLGGEWYLPDFWLPTPGIWLEVKGIEPDQRERRVASLLSRASRCPVMIAVGAPPTREEYSIHWFDRGDYFGSVAFCGTRENLIIASECMNVQAAVRGSTENLSGVPDPITSAGRVAAANRFGVHDQ